jgi:hypothetical protein
MSADTAQRQQQSPNILALGYVPYIIGRIYGATGCGKDARRKSPKADFSTLLGNPANRAGFPLSHSPGDCCHQLKPDKSRAKKTGRFNLLTTAKSS